MIGGGAFSNKVFQDSVHLGSDIEKLVRVVWFLKTSFNRGSSDCHEASLVVIPSSSSLGHVVFLTPSVTSRPHPAIAVRCWYSLEVED
jgi:hypothetical protein